MIFSPNRLINNLLRKIFLPLFFQKSPKKEVEFQANFQLLGTKKAAHRGRLSINLYLRAIRTPTRLRGEHPRRTTYSQP